MARRRSNHEGSIWKQGSHWRAPVSVDGRRITKTFKTVDECRIWLQQTTRQVDQGLSYTTAKVTLEQYLEEWLNIHRSTLTPKTGDRYWQIARDYILPILGKYKLKDLSLARVERCYQTLQEQGASVRTIRYVHSILHRCFKDAIYRGVIGFNPVHGAQLPKKPHQEMAILDEYEAMQFLMAAKSNRYCTLFNLAIKTGMRQGELLALRWSDLDWRKGNLRVQRQTQRVTGQGMVFVAPKTKSGRRTIPLGDEMLQILRQHWEKQQLEKALAGERWQDLDLIFPTRWGTTQCPSNVLKEFKAVLHAAGLRKIRFHDLRHTAASLMLNSNVPAFVVSKILGHSKPSTTLDIYGHLIPVMHQEVGNLMDELLTPIEVKMGETVDQSLPGEGSH